MAVLLLLLAVAAGLRFARLTEPPAVVFDETYYARDACLYLDLGQETCGTNQPSEQSYVHPPLGKWLIAAGIKTFGFGPLGWRVVPAAFGTALVLAVFLLARTVLRDRWAAAVAGLLVATDFLLIVQSRIAMLDIILAFFVALGFLFLALDRDRVLALRRHALAPERPPPPRRHEWRFAAGGALGLAIAVKWSAAWALAPGGLLALAWSAGLWRQARRRRRSHPDEPGGAPSLLRETAVTALALGALPALVYLISYSVWFLENRFDVAAFFDLQERMLRYHLTLTATHTYQSRAWTWPLVLRPIAYYWKVSPEATHILALGNPVTWWAALGAGGWLLARSFRRLRPERVVLAGWLAQYLPWLAVERPLFFFYMTPVVPFMMVALAGALAAFRDLGRPARFLVGVYLVVACGLLLWYFYPVIAAVELPMSEWQSRMWFRRWI